MKSLAALIPDRPTVQATARCEREELIEKIADRLNEGRIKDGFKSLTYRDVALTLHSRQTHEVAILLKECERANHFGKYFWWAVRKKGRTQ